MNNHTTKAIVSRLDTIIALLRTQANEKANRHYQGGSRTPTTGIQAGGYATESIGSGRVGRAIDAAYIGERRKSLSEARERFESSRKCRGGEIAETKEAAEQVLRNEQGASES